MVYLYSEMLFCFKKEGNSDTCYNMDESWRHYAKWSKPVTKRQILYDSTYMKYLESYSKRQKIEWWIPAFGGWGVVVCWWVWSLSWRCKSSGQSYRCRHSEEHFCTFIWHWHVQPACTATYAKSTGCIICFFWHTVYDRTLRSSYLQNFLIILVFGEISI